MRHLLRDPLFHFLAAGFLLFLAASAIRPPTVEDAEAIVIDRPALLKFIQYRSKAFEENAASSMLDAMSDDDRANLIKIYAREEALVREAKKLGLDANDYVIRQRLAQKTEFLAEAVAPAAAPSGSEIETYYATNAERYASPPSATLTHVFVSSENSGDEQAHARAEALLGELRARKAGFNDGGGGDRFMFHKNYVDRTDDYIASQLGDAISDAVFDPATPLNEWVGPFQSQYGWHVVFVASRAARRTPPLEEIRDLVASDLAEELRQASIEKAIDDIVAKYRIDDRLSPAAK